MKALVFLFALFVAITESVLAQPIASVVSADPVQLTCPANPAQLASNIAKQERQNELADLAGWTVVRRRGDIGPRVRAGDLVAVPSSGDGYRIGRVSAQFLKPHALQYLEAFGAQFVARFPGRDFVITTLLRTLAYHRELQKTNPNAASCVTEWRCTSHARAISFDMSYLNMTLEELIWTLQTLEADEKKEVIIYFREMCRKNIHVAVVAVPSVTVATHPQTPAEEENMSPGTQPVAERDGGGR